MTRLKYEFTLGEREQLETEGTIVEICAAVARMIQMIYGKLLRTNTDLSDAFRRAAIMMIVAPDSPCWDPNEDTAGNTCDICMIDPRGRDET